MLTVQMMALCEDGRRRFLTHMHECVCGRMLTLHTPTSAAASPEADDSLYQHTHTHTTSYPHAVVHTKTKAASINNTFIGHILLMIICCTAHSFIIYPMKD